MKYIALLLVMAILITASGCALFKKDTNESDEAQSVSTPTNNDVTALMSGSKRADSNIPAEAEIKESEATKAIDIDSVVSGEAKDIIQDTAEVIETGLSLEDELTFKINNKLENIAAKIDNIMSNHINRVGTINIAIETLEDPKVTELQSLFERVVEEYQYKSALIALEDDVAIIGQGKKMEGFKGDNKKATEEDWYKSAEADAGRVQISSVYEEDDELCLTLSCVTIRNKEKAGVTALDACICNIVDLVDANGMALVNKDGTIITQSEQLEYEAEDLEAELDELLGELKTYEGIQTTESGLDIALIDIPGTTWVLVCSFEEYSEDLLERIDTPIDFTPKSFNESICTK
jgi:hypothetical protein